MEYNSQSLDSKLTRLLLLQELDKESRDVFRVEIKGELGTIKEKCEYTNGKIAAALIEIEALKKINEAREKDLAQLLFLKRILSSRWTWIGLAGVVALAIKFPLVLTIITALKGI
jgi:hypothetical protein